MNNAVTHTEGLLLRQNPPWWMFVWCSQSSSPELMFFPTSLQSLIHSSSSIFCPGTQAQQAFRTEPRNLTVHEGATAVLKCDVLRASGTVQWVKDGLLLGPQRSLPGFPRYSMIGSPKRGKQTRNKVSALSDLNGPIWAEGRNLRKAGVSKVTPEFLITWSAWVVYLHKHLKSSKKTQFT